MTSIITVESNFSVFLLIILSTLDAGILIDSCTAIICVIDISGTYAIVLALDSFCVNIMPDILSRMRHHIAVCPHPLGSITHCRNFSFELQYRYFKYILIITMSIMSAHWFNVHYHVFIFVHPSITHIPRLLSYILLPPTYHYSGTSTSDIIPLFSSKR